MIAIYKRELSSYFNSMIGYVFIAALVCFTGIYFMAYNLYNGLPYFSYSLMSLMNILMFTVPILTMKSMAEERRGRTDQLLLTAPVPLWAVVLGKYLAMVTVLLIAVGTFAVLLLLFLWEDLIGFLPSALSNVLSAFSFRTVFYNFAQYQVFDVSGLILYVSLSALFVFLTIQTLLRRRWN